MLYQVVLDDGSSDIPPTPDLETAKRLALEYLELHPTRKVRIDIWPSATTPPTPMTTMHYDATKGTWSRAQPLP